MANTIRDYSATAASNTTVDGADISEGCSPAGINNAIRGVMADLKDVSTGAVSLESPAADSLSLSGALTTTSTIDGRDVAADGTKLDGIEASADVTDAGNVNPLVDAHLNQSTAASGELLSWNGSDYDWVAAGGGGDLLAANNLSDLDNAATARTNLGVAIGSDVQAHSSVLDGTTASFTTAKDSKLTGIESGATADQTDAEIRAAVEAATDSNVFTDADHTKLNGIATGATAYGDSDVDTHLNTSTAATNEVLSWTGTDYDWVAQSAGGGADLYAANESSPTAQPSATGANAVAIGDGAVSSGANSFAIGFNSESTGSQNVALGAAKATGTLGSLSLGGFGSGYSQASNSWAVAIGRSLASGNTSLAMNITDNTASYGASGANSIAIGQLAKASSDRGVAIGAYAQSSSTSIALNTGWNNLVTTASGSNSVAIGGNTSATSPGSYAFGQQSSSAIRGKYAYAAGQFAAQGDAQGGQFILRCSTTDATPTLLRTNPDAADAGNQIVALSDTCIMFSGTLVAMQNGAQDQGGWEIKGLLKNDGGTTTLVSSNIQTFADGNGWTVALTADNTNNALAITCTGEAAHNIRWVANISTSEVTYA